MKPKKLKGIGGWLIVYLIALIISLISFSAVFFTALNYVLISPSGQLNPVLVLMGAIIVLHVFSLILILKRSKLAIKCNILALWFVVATMIFSAAEVNKIILLNSIEFYLALGDAIIWSAYFVRSKRVKNTFVKKVTF